MNQTTIATLALIATCAVISPILAELLKRARVPDVVIQITLGIIIGPQVLALARLDDVVLSLSDLGLAFLMFLAGYEIDIAVIKGRPLSRASIGWLLSLVMALALAYVLVVRGFALNDLLIGLALTTTALGTLLPILRDADILHTRFGTYVLGIGTLGEFAPIVAIAVLLTGSAPARTVILLVFFVLIALAAAIVAARPRTPRAIEFLQRNLHSSAQLPVRISVLLIIALVWLASNLGLDVLLGAFAAGVVVRLFGAGTGRDAETIRIKLEAIGFGFLIPIFFIVSGMKFDIHALTSEPSTFLRLPLFLGLFLVVRGTPALLLYRRDLPRRELAPLAFLSATGLPLIVVITSIGTSTGRMRPENAAALVGAGMLSVLIYPLIAFALLRRAGAPESPPEDEADELGLDADGDPTEAPEPAPEPEP